MIVRAEFNSFLLAMDTCEFFWEIYLLLPYWRGTLQLGRLKWVVGFMFASTCTSLFLFHPTMFLADPRVLAACPYTPFAMFFMCIDFFTFGLATLAMAIVTRDIWEKCSSNKDEVLVASSGVVKRFGPSNERLLVAACVFYACTTALITADAYFMACGSKHSVHVAEVAFWILVCIEEMPRISALLVCLYWTGKLQGLFAKGTSNTRESNDATWFDPYIQYLRSLVGFELGSFVVICFGVLMQVLIFMGLVQSKVIHDEIQIMG